MKAPRLNTAAMKVLLVLAALVAFAAADCTNMQRLKVKEQWHRAYGTGDRRIQAGLVIWRAFFAHKPEAVTLFDRVNGKDISSPEFEAHSSRVLGAIEMMIDLLDHGDTLEHALEHLHEQHIARKIPSSYVHAMKEVLMQIIPAALGRCFDHDAWSSCLDVIFDGVF